MVVRKDYRHRVAAHRGLKDVAGVHRRGVDAALGDEITVDDAAPAVHAEQEDHLVAAPDEFRPQEGPHLFNRGEDHAVFVIVVEVPPREPGHQLEQRRDVRADPLHLAELVEIRVQYAG